MSPTSDALDDAIDVNIFLDGAYNPYGGVIADLGTNLNRQQYKFGARNL